MFILLIRKIRIMVNLLCLVTFALVVQQCAVFCDPIMGAKNSAICAYMLVQAFLSAASGYTSFLKSMVSLVEMESIDQCKSLASATWDEFIAQNSSVDVQAQRIEQEFHLGLFAKASRTDIQSAYKQSSLGPHDELLRRKVQLFIQPGDLLLETSHWLKLNRIAVASQSQIRLSSNYDCGNGTYCTLSVFHNKFARQKNLSTLFRMKSSWEKNLISMDKYVDHVLPLLRDVSKDHNSIEEHWDSLVELEGALQKARDLWNSIKPLYEKLHKFVSWTVKRAETIGSPLPVYYLNALNGDDWSNVAVPSDIMQEYFPNYEAFHENLQRRGIGGVDAFKAAGALIKELNLGEVKPEIWAESVFNGTCPPTLVDWCEPDKLRVISCSDVSFSNYLDAHETAMEIVYKQTMASNENNTYVFRYAPRYSAIYEAIPGFLSMVALSPQALARNQLYPIDMFNDDPNYHRGLLQLILALRDLPKLNYYLAADEWRLNVLRKKKMSGPEAAANWAVYRRKFSLLSTSGVEFLADPYIIQNKPFIGKFLGLILKYQIYQSYAEEMIARNETDIIKYVAANNKGLMDAMLKGFSVKWPSMVGDLLSKKADSVKHTSLLDYYKPLEQYLDQHLSTITDN